MFHFTVPPTVGHTISLTISISISVCVLFTSLRTQRLPANMLAQVCIVRVALATSAALGNAVRIHSILYIPYRNLNSDVEHDSSSMIIIIFIPVKPCRNRRQPPRTCGSPCKRKHTCGASGPLRRPRRGTAHESCSLALPHVAS